MLTLQDLVRLLTIQCDPDELIEILDISSKEICERFEDKIEEHFEELQEDFKEEEDDKKNEDWV